MDNHGGAFVSRAMMLGPFGDGWLKGMTFAVKDVFGIAGYVSGAGNPEWLRTGRAATRHSEAIVRLLAQGARLVGTTHTDELMYSLNGENAHYGTPVNPKAPGRIPGGSSSGSAVAVASGAVDFALGTDTGGSVRIPSAYCGVYGFRPTHGLVPADGVIPLAPRFDTVGWMARGPKELREVGAALIGGGSGSGAPPGSGFGRLLWASDVWALVDEPCREALLRFAPAIERTTSRSEWTDVATDGLAAWSDAFRVLQGLEAWKQHGEWIERSKPGFGDGIAQRFEWASKLTAADGERPERLRESASAALEALLGEDGLLVIPTAPGIAPLLRESGEQVEIARRITLMMTCVAGLTGLPQATLPLAEVDGCPVGLSVVGGRGQDLRVLEWVERVTIDLSERAGE
ncbi:amidase [Cohnella suwonensis]|uniref:Amidase n=1 Tax=Cohnella suwonensis TaxID=696072 RepID=A0ABW0LWL1_9BACL